MDLQTALYKANLANNNQEIARLEREYQRLFEKYCSCWSPGQPLPSIVRQAKGRLDNARKENKVENN